MPLIRHVAGLPTATEQRCVRCCEVIRDIPEDHSGIVMAWWPGRNAFVGEGNDILDCTPHDPHAIDEFKEALRQALEAAR